MKNLLIRISILLLLPSLMTAADLDWNAQFRVYYNQVDDSALNKGYSRYYMYLRSRLMFRMTQSRLSGTVQLQEVRRLHHPDSNSGLTKPDATPLGFHQAFITADQVIYPGWKVYLGRFEMDLGSQRLFSSNQWNLNGRSFDGVRFTSRGSIFTQADLFSLTSFDQEFPDSLGNQIITASGFFISPIISKAKPIGISQVNFFGYNEFFNPDSGQSFSRNTFGSRVNFSFLMFNIELEGAKQTGYAEENIKADAMMGIMNFDVSTKILPVIKKIGIGRELYTGSNGIEDGVAEGFANPYGAGHRYHGYYDEFTFFKNNHGQGIKEWNLRFDLEFRKNVLTKVRYHSFRQGLKDGGDLGSEINVEYVHKIGMNGKLVFGYASHSYGEATSKSGTVTRAYTNFTVRF